jgi:ribose/xylose/arabinose/galactoside ABC-type transport system permease subunit
MGGEGNMLGLVTGVFILAVLGDGMQLAGWGTYAQYIVNLSQLMIPNSIFQTRMCH